MDAAVPGPGEILRHFSVDVPWVLVLTAAALGYFRAYRESRASASCRPHARLKLVAFFAGLVLVALAVVSPLRYYGNEVLWIDFAGFLVLTMLAPPLLWLGSPLTLAFRVSGPDGRRKLRHLYRSRAVAALTFPAVAWLLFAVVTYLWQLTSLTDVAARHWWVRDIQQMTLLFVSLCFWLPALNPGPMRWRLPDPLRALYVFVEMTHKALFGAIFLSLTRPLHHHFAHSVPAWGPSPMLDQQVAIAVLWVGGNLVFLLALAIVIAHWVQADARATVRLDRRLAAEREVEQRRRAALEQIFRR
jgi:cytochrome c oxidase assembly factor CtaG